MSTPVDGLELRPAEPPARSVEEILFPTLHSLTPGLLRLTQARDAATTHLAYNRERAAAILEMRQQGYKMRAIGRALGLTDVIVKLALQRARKAGILDDTRDILEHEAAPLAAEKMIAHMRSDKAKGSLKAASELLHGLGRLKTHTNNKNEGGAGGSMMRPLQVNVMFATGITPPATAELLVQSDAVVGVPRLD